MQKLRNIAIIAHVDHGKTTLVDKMILAGHILRDNAKPAGELILDNNDLERERKTFRSSTRTTKSTSSTPRATPTSAARSSAC